MISFKKINLVKFLKLEAIETKAIYLLAFVVFIITNLIVSSLPLRIDFSSGGAYSLSSSTKKILKNLDDVLNIKFFVSSDIPTRLLPLRNDVLDFLNEYKKESKKINIKVLDPKKDEKALNEAKELGLPELQFSQLEKDKYAVTNVYFGLAINYADKKEILPQVTDLESLEYNITSIIYKLTNKELAKIAILGKKEVFNPQDDDLATFKKIARQQFILDFIDVSTSSAQKEIPLVYKTVLVFDDSKKEYDEQEIEALKKYLKEKGNVIFFVDGVWLEDNLVALEAKHNLFSLLEDYGLSLQKDFVLSTSSELVNFGNQMVQFLTAYPFWVKTNNFNPKISYFSNIGQLTYPWVSSINLKKKEDLKLQELVKSTKKSWQQKNNFVLDPQRIPEPNITDLKEFIITASATKKNEGKIVLIPCSRFILERYQNRTADNLEFTLNLLNDLASGGALSGIRQRAISFYPLPEISEQQKDLFKYLNIFLLPSLLAIIGGIKLIKRK